MECKIQGSRADASFIIHNVSPSDPPNGSLKPRSSVRVIWKRDEHARVYRQDRLMSGIRTDFEKQMSPAGRVRGSFRELGTDSRNYGRNFLLVSPPRHSPNPSLTSSLRPLSPFGPFVVPFTTCLSNSRFVIRIGRRRELEDILYTRSSPAYTVSACVYVCVRASMCPCSLGS